MEPDGVPAFAHHIKGMRIIDCQIDEAAASISWLELFIWFESWRSKPYAVHRPGHASILDPQASASAVVRAFTKEFRDYATTHFQVDDAVLFLPDSAYSARLRPFAIDSSAASTGFVPCVSRDFQRVIARGLLAQRGCAR